MNIVTIVGARPQFVKAAVVSRALDATSSVNEILIHTGQHYDMNLSGSFFEDLDIPEPDHNLQVGSATHGVQTGKILERLEPLLMEYHPDLVVIYGDTNSTLAGALAAAKLHIPLAHVEAGLRSFNRRMPEEINRVVADHISDILLAPTPVAVENLDREGLTPESIHLVGDVMKDAVAYYSPRADRETGIGTQVASGDGPYVLATIHRPENTDDPVRLKAIFEGLAQVASEIPVVLPLHPRTKKYLQQLGWSNPVEERLRLREPAGYLEMLQLAQHATAIVTDSGGVQKEAYFHKLPCITLRDETEWTELVDWGCNRRISPDSAEVVAHGIQEALRAGFPSQIPEDLYGDGKAGERIARILVS